MSKVTVGGVIAILSVLGLLGMAGALLFITVPPSNEKYFYIVAMALVGNVGTAYGYYLGSSQGSSEKNKLIASINGDANGKVNPL